MNSQNALIVWQTVCSLCASCGARTVNFFSVYLAIAKHCSNLTTIGWAQWILFEPIVVVRSTDDFFCCVSYVMNQRLFANWVWMANNCPSYLISPNYIAFFLCFLIDRYSDTYELGKCLMKLICAKNFFFSKSWVAFGVRLFFLCSFSSELFHCLNK